MTTATRDTDGYETIGPDAEDMSRYGSFESEDGLVVYNRENENRWIQCEAYVELAERR